MDLLSFDIRPSDAQATSIYSALIVIISLKVFYSFTNITLPLLRIFGKHSSVSPMLLFGRFLIGGGHKFSEFACCFRNQNSWTEKVELLFTETRCCIYIYIYPNVFFFFVLFFSKKSEDIVTFVYWSVGPLPYLPTPPYTVDSVLVSWHIAVVSINVPTRSGEGLIVFSLDPISF